MPQGGNTGLVGGAVPHDAVVLSTARLSSIGDVDPVAGAVTAGAGVTLERLQRAAAEAGLAFGVDLAARGSATVGGMIATDAGGIHALRHGSMRRQVAGIEAVLADGTVVRQRAGGTAPVGVDLVSLLSGSEGTLAVITGARLRLVPILPERATALIAFDDVAAAVVATAYARARLPDLDAVELVDAASLALAASRVGQPVPFNGSGPALLVETASTRPMLDDLAAALQSMPGMRDAVVAADGPGRRRLWALREGVTEAISSVGIPHKLDVGLPLGRLAAFVEALEADGRRRGRRCARLRLRPSGPRQPARQRDRSGARGRARRRRRPAPGPRPWRLDRRRARHRSGEGALARARAVSRRVGGSGRDQARARPGGASSTRACWTQVHEPPAGAEWPSIAGVIKGPQIGLHCDLLPPPISRGAEWLRIRSFRALVAGLKLPLSAPGRGTWTASSELKTNDNSAKNVGLLAGPPRQSHDVRTSTIVVTGGWRGGP